MSGLYHMQWAVCFCFLNQYVAGLQRIYLCVHTFFFHTISKPYVTTRPTCNCMSTVLLENAVYIYKHSADTVTYFNWGSRLSVSSFPNSPPAAAASWVEREEPFRPVYLPGNDRNALYLQALFINYDMILRNVREFALQIYQQVN